MLCLSLFKTRSASTRRSTTSSQVRNDLSFQLDIELQGFKSSFYQDRLGTNKHRASSIDYLKTATVSFPAFAAAQSVMQLFDDDLEPVAVRKTPLSAPFIYKSHLFTKTGSGQT